jgi:hypothetical protein
MLSLLNAQHLSVYAVSCTVFDRMVKPTLLYGCEIWGLWNIEIIERVPIKLCNLLHRKLASFTVYISKHNLYIINDNLDSLPNNNFDQNDRILIFTSRTIWYLRNSP